MRLRSLLFVPGDSQRKFEKALVSDADALILDLEDAVAPSKKGEARALIASWLRQEKPLDPALFVRVNPLNSGLIQDDLAAVVAQGLAAVVLPKCNGADDLEAVSRMIEELEVQRKLAPGSVKILVVATETPAAMFALGEYKASHRRLLALTWGAEDLGAAIGAISNKNADGSWTFPFQVARAQCLFAAANAEVIPIDTLYANFRDDAGLKAACDESRRDGFCGRIAIHPEQVATINRCFTPTAEEIAMATKIVKAFEAQPDVGTLGIEGQMYDIPHLNAARKVLNAAGC